MAILLIIITITSILVAIYCAINKKQVDTQTSIENEKLLNEYIRLQRLRDEISDSLQEITRDHSDMIYQNNKLQETINERKSHLSTIQETIDTTLKNQEKLSQEAFKNYCEILDNQYKETEKEYDLLKENLENSYSKIQLDLMRETDECKAELDKIRSTRAAAIEAERREKMIEEDLSSYCLTILDSDKADIARLDALKPSLNKPRVLSMLIWQTWFQKPLKSLSASIVGTDDKMGIYKITNIKTKECYIGQAVNIKDRWVEHVKYGLGIDTPSGNKLYKAMSDYGLWNFSFEVLEECTREQLNEKEKYYISLYNSYEFGYNSTRGNK